MKLSHGSVVLPWKIEGQENSLCMNDDQFLVWPPLKKENVKSLVFSLNILVKDQYISVPCGIWHKYFSNWSHSVDDQTNMMHSRVCALSKSKHSGSTDDTRVGAESKSHTQCQPSLGTCMSPVRFPIPEKKLKIAMIIFFPYFFHKHFYYWNADNIFSEYWLLIFVVRFPWIQTRAAISFYMIVLFFLARSSRCHKLNKPMFFSDVCGANESLIYLRCLDMYLCIYCI